MPAFGESGVEWECVAREFRAKYTGAPSESASLKAANAVLTEMLPEFKAIPGFVEAKRFVCGECGDIKLVVSLKDADFGGWAGKDFAPGAQLLEKWGAIEGLSAIETQNYTIAAM
ncbi:unnamed protein product [Amoebophrya sp. A25]|nr:unnamed protein product [Amoebophrya sp. A25]|eukprot:GSA25T00001123001.1